MGERKHRAIAVIPARGGSKRLPRKALIDFQGKAMIAHTIHAALEAERFDKVVVSSDSDEILDIAAQHGAQLHKRNNHLAQDDTATAPVLLDLLEHEIATGTTWDVLACLYATAPLRTADDIVAVLDLLLPGTCDFAMAVSEADRPVHQAMIADKSGSLSAVWPNLINVNSQEAPTYLFGNGSTYAVTVDAFMNSKSLYGPGLRGHVMPRERSVDLDTKEDLALLHFYANLGKT